MNKGLVVGRVSTPAGRGARGAYVKLIRVVGEDGNLSVPQAGVGAGKGEATADVKGGFAIPFTWSGTEIGSAIIPVTIHLAAYTERVSGSSSQVTAMGRAQTRGFLVKDVAGQMKAVVDAIAGIPDLKDFAVELVDKYSLFQKYEIFKVMGLSTEGWMIVGAASLHLH